jgi:cytochrome c biogenesis protein CcmG/thiol:disulfide interchange protein DsbE
MRLRASGVRVVGLAYKDDPAKTAAFLDRLGDPFATVLVDRDGRAGIELGVSGVPETFLVAPDGVVVAKHAGPLTPEVAGTLLVEARSLGQVQVID